LNDGVLSRASDNSRPATWTVQRRWRKDNVVGTQNLISKKYKQMTFISIDVEMILPRIEFRLDLPITKSARNGNPTHFIWANITRAYAFLDQRSRHSRS